MRNEGVVELPLGGGIGEGGEVVRVLWFFEVCGGSQLVFVSVGGEGVPVCCFGLFDDAKVGVFGRFEYLIRGVSLFLGATEGVVDGAEGGGRRGRGPRVFAPTKGHLVGVTAAIGCVRTARFVSNQLHTSDGLGTADAF